MIYVHWSTPGSQRGERHGMGVTTCGHQPALGVARPTAIGRSITGAFGTAPRRTATTDSFERVIASRVARFRMAPQPGVEERRDVLFLRDPRILVAHMFEEEQ